MWDLKLKFLMPKFHIQILPINFEFPYFIIANTKIDKYILITSKKINKYFLIFLLLKEIQIKMPYPKHKVINFIDEIKIV